METKQSKDEENAPIDVNKNNQENNSLRNMNRSTLSIRSFLKDHNYLPYVFTIGDLDETKCKEGRLIDIEVDPYIPKKKGMKMPIKQVVFPVISTEDAIQALKQFSKKSCVYKSSCLDTLRILSDEMFYCYSIDVDSCFQSRSVGYEIFPCNMNPCKNIVQEVEIRPWEVDSSSTTSDDFYLSNSERMVICPSCSEYYGEESLESSLLPNGQTKCSMCGGSRLVRQYIKIHSEVSTQSFSRLLNRSPLSGYVLDKLEGRLIYEISGNRIIPNNVFLDGELNNAIADTLDGVSKWAKDRCLFIQSQQLYVSIIPVRQLKCLSGNKEFTALVYDYDKKVICNDFPRRFDCLRRSFSRKK